MWKMELLRLLLQMVPIGGPLEVLGEHVGQAGGAEEQGAGGGNSFPVTAVPAPNIWLVNAVFHVSL